MYKKLLLSAVLVACIIYSPVAEAKGAIPIIIAPITYITNTIITPVVEGIVTLVDCALNPFSCLPKDDDPDTKSISAPSAPQNVKITNCDGEERNADGSCVLYINHGYRITWDAPANLGGASSVGYRIYRSQNENLLNAITITTSELDAGQKYFEENRIQDPSQPFYYKVVAFNNAGESVGSVVMAPTDIRYLTDILTLTGSGFSDDTKVYLINNGNSILCVGFTAPDSHTLTGGICDITSAPTGSWTVRIQNPDGKRSDWEVFKIALPEPVSPTVNMTKIDLGDGVFKIDSIAGDNLYTGASVRVVSDGNKLDCFSLSSFDYKNNEFPGGQCNVAAFQEFLKTLGFTSDSDIAKLSIEILNDPNSAPVIPTGIPTFICESTSYTPDASTVCGTSSITQYSNCGVFRSAMPQLVCASGQVCQDGACVGCTPLTQSAACSFINNNTQYYYCDSRKVDDNCGGKITCDASICSTSCNVICQ